MARSKSKQKIRTHRFKLRNKRRVKRRKQQAAQES
jgi:hypothetical protein